MRDSVHSDSPIELRAAVRRELGNLTATVNATVERLPGQQASDVARLLRETSRSIQTMIPSPTSVKTAHVTDNQRGYFPVTDSPVGQLISDTDMKVAQERWANSFARGRSYRARALAEIGPLLTPHEVSEQLGVSVTTVNNWRNRGKLLGVRFDDHQYVYPAWQFVESPVHGSSGVLKYFNEILACFVQIHPWEIARFLITPQPLFGGRTPLEVLRRGTVVEIDLLKDLASHLGEIGT